MSRNRMTAGVTLLELLLALAILAVLVGVAVPRVGRSERRYAALVAARELRADLARARMIGILGGATAWVEIDTAGAGYRVIDGTGRTVRRRALAPGITLRTTAHRERIPFTARGTSNLYSTTSIRAADDPAARWHVLRVAPTGAVEAR